MDARVPSSHTAWPALSACYPVSPNNSRSTSTTSSRVCYRRHGDSLAHPPLLVMNIAQHAAMDELVGFKFNVSINQEVDLFNYVLKPVRQTQVAQVPLYVALFLASQHKGIIQLPDYLTA